MSFELELLSMLLLSKYVAYKDDREQNFEPHYLNSITAVAPSGIWR